jgi:endonuclease YncB( thermonuclease family)
MMDIPQEWLAFAVFVLVSVLTGILLGRVLPMVLRRRRRGRRAGNVVQLNCHPHRRQRPRMRLPKIHPLAWLIGFAVLGYGYMLLFEDGPARPGARTLTGSVTHVRDGDTIEVSGVPIRFAGLDCAELGTAAGERAKQKMVRLVAGRQLQCELTGRRSYDRMIGECDLRDDCATSGLEFQ